MARTQHTYDAFRRLTNVSHRCGTATLNFEEVVYDAASRITRITTPARHEQRISTTRAISLPPPADHTQAGLVDEAFTYDASGNRAGIVAALVRLYQIGPGNRLLADGTYNYQYDGEGNLAKAHRDRFRQIPRPIPTTAATV